MTPPITCSKAAPVLLCQVHEFQKKTVSPELSDAEPVQGARADGTDTLEELHGAVPARRRHASNLPIRAFLLADPRC